MNKPPGNDGGISLFANRSASTASTATTKDDTSKVPDPATANPNHSVAAVSQFAAATAANNTPGRALAALFANRTAANADSATSNDDPTKTLLTSAKPNHQPVVATPSAPAAQKIPSGGLVGAVTTHTDDVGETPYNVPNHVPNSNFITPFAVGVATKTPAAAHQSPEGGMVLFKDCPVARQSHITATAEDPKTPHEQIQSNGQDNFPLLTVTPATNVAPSVTGSNVLPLPRLSTTIDNRSARNFYDNGSTPAHKPQSPSASSDPLFVKTTDNDDGIGPRGNVHILAQQDLEGTIPIPLARTASVTNEFDTTPFVTDESDPTPAQVAPPAAAPTHKPAPVPATAYVQVDSAPGALTASPRLVENTNKEAFADIHDAFERNMRDWSDGSENYEEKLLDATVSLDQCMALFLGVLGQTVDAADKMEALKLSFEETVRKISSDAD